MRKKQIVVAIGGAKGVGKTSLVSILKRKYPEVRIFNCGKILKELAHSYFKNNFEKLSIKNRNKLRKICGKIIIKNFSEVNLIDLHFGEPENRKYISAIPKILRTKLTHLILLSASNSKIFERRMKSGKPRKLDIGNISMNSNGEYEIAKKISAETEAELFKLDNDEGNASIIKHIELFLGLGSISNQKVKIDLMRKLNEKKLLISYRRKEIIADAMPNRLWIEPTNICNSHCPLCPTGTGETKREKRIMRIGEFKKIINQTAPFVSSINLWNLGEPFLNNGIFEMIKYASGKFISTRVSTNGYVFYDSKNIHQLISCGLDNLVVSIDGVTPDVFNKYRVGLDLKKIMSGLVAIHKEKKERKIDHPNVVWQYIVMKHNQHQIKKAEKIARNLEMIFDLKSVNMQMTNKNIDFDDYLPSRNDLRRYKKDGKNKYTLKVKRKNECPEPWFSMMINSNGDVAPCCYDYESELSLGNIKNQKIKSVWNGDKMRKLRKTILKNKNSLAPCKKCSINSKSVIFLNNII